MFFVVHRMYTSLRKQYIRIHIYISTYQIDKIPTSLQNTR